MPSNPSTSGRRWLPQIWLELENGRLEERPLVNAKRNRAPIEGLLSGQTVTVNPVYPTVATLVHELFHRRYPHWSERYVIARTTELMRLMTEPEMLKLYREYCRRVRRCNRRVVVS